MGKCLKILRFPFWIGKGANLVVHVILHELNAFFEENAYFPDVFFIQIDGGAENANWVVLGMLELIIIKRMAMGFLITCLRAGHGNTEVIDEAFGVFKRALD